MKTQGSSIAWSAFARRSACAIALPALSALAAWPAAAAPYQFPRYAGGADVKTACDAMLQDVRGREQAIAAAQGVAAPPVLEALDQMAQRAEDVLGPLGLLANVHPDKPVRDAAEACDLAYQTFLNQLYQNPRIHRRLVVLAPADPIDAELRSTLLASFEDAGVALPAKARAQARKLNVEIVELAQAFDRQLREDKTRVPFTDAELDGVPRHLLDALAADGHRDAQGRTLLGLDYPTVDPVLEAGRIASTRQTLWRAFMNRGGDANLQRLAQLGQKRRALARLFGQPSYADFVLRRRMAGSVANVQRFLDEVKGVVEAREVQDIGDLRASKAQDLQQPLADTRIERWDVAYYTERVKRERYALDQESFRRYLPPDACVDVLFALSGRLFGIGFKRVDQPTWHPDVRAFEVLDQASGATLATLYLDLYPRADKYGHAAMWPVRSSAAADVTVPGAARLPVAALVTNFDRKGLTLDEFQTLLHEFGHALHGTLTHTRHAQQSGTNTKLDFVEAPSQMLEEWVYDPAVLALFQQVCPSCQPVPADMLAQAVKARSFGKGRLFARQHLFASYDLALYAADAPPPGPTWEKLEGATPLGHVPATRFPASFTHLSGGYAAGYYAYLWSLATAQDLHTAFAADHLDAAVGRRYRDTVLANGAQLPATELVTRFLGRAPSNAAFFDWLKQ